MRKTTVIVMLMAALSLGRWSEDVPILVEIL
jgi:hypothetical protein